MEKIGDYIPLIIIGLTFVYSFIRKAGKKAAEEEVSKTTLPVDIPDREMVIPRVKPKPQPVVSKPAEKILHGNQEPFLKNKAQPLAFIEEVVEDERLVLDFSNTEELKKGIIFSEVFNRKY